MIVENVEVKSKDTTVGTVNVQKFETLQEAVDFFQAEEIEEAKSAKREPNPNYGVTETLSLINSQHRANVTNAERVAKTRGVSPMKALRDKIKADPNAKAKLEALLLSLDLPANLNV